MRYIWCDVIKRVNNFIIEPIPKDMRGKFGCINIDIDTMASDYTPKMKTITNLKLADICWSKTMSRVLKLFKECNIKCTFFIIGSHLRLPSCRENIQLIIKAGHEVANHSMNHLKHFALLSNAEIEKEIRECHDLLCETTGKVPIGFRAPGYTITRNVIKVLATRGYRYDASLNMAKLYNVINFFYIHFLLKKPSLWQLAMHVMFKTNKFNKIFSKNIKN